MLKKRLSAITLFLMLLVFLTEIGAQPFSIPHPMVFKPAFTVPLAPTVISPALKGLGSKDFILPRDVSRSLRINPHDFSRINDRLIVNHPDLSKLTDEARLELFASETKSYYIERNSGTEIEISIYEGATLSEIIMWEIGVRLYTPRFWDLVAEIVRVNGLKDANTIKAGDSIIIPRIPPDVLRKITRNERIARA